MFADEGAGVSLNRIAERAGVGKASLYRQFQGREGLILEVFGENIADLEAAAAGPKATVESVTEAIVRQLVASIGFLSVLIPDPSAMGVAAGPARRISAVLQGLIEAGRFGGFRSDLTVGELHLAITMLGSALYTAPEAQRPEISRGAWPLLRRALT